jgi:hypothetical protein
VTDARKPPIVRSVDRVLTEREKEIWAAQIESERRWAGWFRGPSYYRGFGVETPEEFDAELRRLTEEMSESRAWKEWWSQVDRPHLDLECVYEGQRPPYFGYKTRHRRLKDTVRATMTFSYDEHRGLDAASARAHISALAERLAKSYELDVPPSLP